MIAYIDYTQYKQYYKEQYQAEVIKIVRKYRTIEDNEREKFMNEIEAKLPVKIIRNNDERFSVKRIVRTLNSLILDDKKISYNLQKVIKNANTINQHSYYRIKLHLEG